MHLNQFIVKKMTYQWHLTAYKGGVEVRDWVRDEGVEAGGGDEGPIGRGDDEEKIPK